MDQLDAMQIYVRVAELSSFTQAAESMGLPKASISSAVQQLESQLGTRLLHRTTRKVQMTQDGQAFYERSKDLLADMDELQTMFLAGQADLTGRLRVDMPNGIAQHIVMPQLPAFLAAHPKLEVELGSTDRRVDLVREGFDCVLRVGTLADSSLIARPLGHFRLLNCASRDYLSRRGTPRRLEDLVAHSLIHYVPVLGARSAGFEYLDPASGETRFLAMAGAVTVNNSDAYMAGCLAGLGLIQVPEVGVGKHLASGQLVEVLPDWRAAPMPVSLLYANRRQLPRRVQAFMAWIAEVMQPHLA
ncbi:LysR family transcriptional regulator [Chitinimonas koreensis]|uniref:LysR family transcriptional regulator n=1 Tax=Chitinimonas koreensis TaxID=356302 RepID=UPI00041787A3|nr:LysR family transcriptional regulator [Chitinimonas koreensis]QNM96078.1 LysR family transcriptional regulator [Chitinimonas koreensis]